MVFTIEPMINQGSADIVLLDDDWTVETRDKKLSAQFEHTLAILEDGVEVMTLSKKDTRFDRVFRKGNFFTKPIFAVLNSSSGNKYRDALGGPLAAVCATSTVR